VNEPQPKQTAKESNVVDLESAKATPPTIQPGSELDLDHPSLYLNRELTWLAFNRRVLNEALDNRNPLLERVKFFAIFASNLDEFFMKRIGGLKLQAATGFRKPTVDGKTPEQQLTACWEMVREIEAERDQALPLLMSELNKHGISIACYKELTPEEQAQTREHYIENVFPLVTPQVVDSAHPFPFISNLSLNILVSLQGPGSDEPIPVGIGVPRLIEVSKYRFVPLEEVIANNLDLLFPEVTVLSHALFFVARNASTEKEESGANDLMAMIESELQDRRIAPIVRIVVNEYGRTRPQYRNRCI